MKIDTGSSIHSLNGNIGATRKLAEIPATKTSSQDEVQLKLSNAAAKEPNFDEPQAQLSGVTPKTSSQEDPQAQLTKEKREKVEKALKIINMAYKEVNLECRYSMDDRTNTEVVKIVNSETGEMIRQYPPEDILNMIHKMFDMFGILMDKKV